MTLVIFLHKRDLGLIVSKFTDQLFPWLCIPMKIVFSHFLLVMFARQIYFFLTRDDTHPEGVSQGDHPPRTNAVVEKDLELPQFEHKYPARNNAVIKEDLELPQDERDHSARSDVVVNKAVELPQVEEKSGSPPLSSNSVSFLFSFLIIAQCLPYPAHSIFQLSRVIIGSFIYISLKLSFKFR